MTPMTQRPMTASEWTMLLALSVLWGGSFFFVGVVVDELPPLTIVIIRVGLAAIALWLIAFAMGHTIPLRAEVWRAFFGMGLLNNVIPFSLIVWGQTHIASGLASILNATTPLFTVLVAHALTADERMTSTRLFGVLAGLAGTIVLIGPGALDGIGTGLHGPGRYPHSRIVVCVRRRLRSSLSRVRRAARPDGNRTSYSVNADASACGLVS